jgi:hypothetical protein
MPLLSSSVHISAGIAVVMVLAGSEFWAAGLVGRVVHEMTHGRTRWQVHCGKSPPLVRRVSFERRIIVEGIEA